MGPVHRWVFGAGFAALAVAVLALLAPVHGPGLSGSALEPHINSFGWYDPTPVPVPESRLHAAPVDGPWDSLEHRRRQVATAAAVAAGLLEAGLVLRRIHRRRASTREPGTTKAPT